MALIKRHLEKVITDLLFGGKAIVVIGARQVGKSTLFKQILGRLDKSISKDEVLAIDCDDPEQRALLDNANIATLNQLLAGKRIVMVDEAQRIKGIGITLKMIIDHFNDIQLLVTGSSSFLLQGQLNEPLTGRKFEYHLYPISTQELYEDSGLIRVKQTLESRLIYGSYPDVVASEKNIRTLLMNLSGSYMYQDLLSLESVRKPVLLEKLLVALALQVGSEVSYNEIAQTIGTDNKTVEKYIDLLEKCYIVFRLNGLSRNLRNELKKSKKIYFYDNGIRNAVIQQFAPADRRNDMGALWENFFISERKKYNHYNGKYVNVYFWRTNEQQEIDYVEECDGTMTAFEMKWNPKKGSSSFPKSFLEAYDVKETVVITPENYLDWLI
ncbi:MAG: ATP-binding protein [Bacteroidales bacterium]|nr:ATP-binding protein [Bacteroidales bacterium]